jgi:hypothetical protein
MNTLHTNIDILNTPSPVEVTVTHTTSSLKHAGMSSTLNPSKHDTLRDISCET